MHLNYNLNVSKLLTVHMHVPR